ncbi:PrpF domain-containing protein [Kineococcus gynurae]|uniref:PrpF domain-containing protein n=1 Tax=Kineococcus gynurae TaxID=452979 RepID=A0ABV5LMT0_9ACTN
MDVKATLVRGGTSKCWLFSAVDVPRERGTLEALLLAAYGAADSRQIDGVGGATSTTSKAAVVGRSRRDDADIDYLFAQVGIGERSVEWGSNCGNCATAIALYAVTKGLVPVAGDVTRVRMHHLGTGARLDGLVATPGGAVPVEGHATVPGTEAEGVPVGLSFLDADGRTTGSLFPTGVRRELLRAGSRDVEVTMIDAGAPLVLAAAGPLGLTATETVEELAPHLGDLIDVRAAAAVAMGLRRPDEPVRHAVPKVGIVGPPADHKTDDGRVVLEEDVDLVVRMLSMFDVHPVIGLTSAVGLATAALEGGTLVSAVARPGLDGVVRLGTPGGVVTVTVSEDGDGHREVTVQRAARVIADATIYTPELV